MDLRARIGPVQGPTPLPTHGQSGQARSGHLSAEGGELSLVHSRAIENKIRQVQI